MEKARDGADEKGRTSGLFKVIGNSEEVISMVSALRRTILMIREADTSTETCQETETDRRVKNSLGIE